MFIQAEAWILNAEGKKEVNGFAKANSNHGNDRNFKASLAL